MKAICERRAFLIAVIAAGAALLATLGLATAIRPAQFSTSPATDVLIADVSQGRKLFLLNCALGDEGPNLHHLHKSDARIHQVVTAGIKGEMPSFGKKLHDSDIRALTAYLRTLR